MARLSLVRVHNFKGVCWDIQQVAQAERKALAETKTFRQMKAAFVGLITAC